MKKVNYEEQHQKDLERIANFRLLDDDFMSKVFEDETGAVEEVLRVIMDKADLMVKDVQVQREIRNLQGRYIRLDVYAVDAEGKQYDIEIQRADKGAGRRRARHNSSMLDANFLRPQEDPKLLPETYVVFITENDVLGHGLPIYTIERQIQETNELFDDGEHIIYVNAAYENEETEIGRLMHDFREKDPSKMQFPKIAKRSNYFKNTEEGRATMCKAMEDMRNETIVSRDREKIEEMFKNGATKEQILTLGGYPKDLVEEVEASLFVEA